MRYKQDHKEHTRQKIVERAAREYREHGFDGVGIAKLMSLLGLTHGGFYAHFADKDDLKDEAMEFAFDQSVTLALEQLRRGGVQAYVDFYTSDGHRDHPELGCVLAALSAEEGRRPAASRSRFARKYNHGIKEIASYMPGETEQERISRTNFLLASLSGAVTLARAAGDPETSAAILNSTREHLTRFLATL